MTTPVTEISYPPYDSQALHTFITDQGGTVTGDLQTDFRNALFISVAPGGKANDYSIDDLWARHIQVNVSGDANAAPGNPAAAGRGKLGFVGMSLVAYYIQTYLRNPGNANAFPGAGSSTGQEMLMTVAGGVTEAVISNGGLTMTGVGANFSWAYSTINDRDFTEGGKYTVEVTLDTTGTYFAMGMYDPAQVVSAAYGGNVDGCGILLAETGSGLDRIYHGPGDNNFTDAVSAIYPSAGTVITLAINLDDDEITYYQDGVTMGVHSISRSTPTSNDLRIVFKNYGTGVMSINTETLYPVDGFEPWG